MIIPLIPPHSQTSLWSITSTRQSLIYNDEPEISWLEWLDDSDFGQLILLSYVRPAVIKFG